MAHAKHSSGINDANRRSRTRFHDCVQNIGGKGLRWVYVSSPRAELFAVLAWYTGHRSASIRQLRWSDVDFDNVRIHWRGEVDKIGYDHWNPLHPTAAELLKDEQTRVAAIGDAWVFDVDGEALSRQGVRSLWRRIAGNADIPDKERHGWHSVPARVCEPAPPRKPSRSQRLGRLEVRANRGCRVSAAERIGTGRGVVGARRERRKSINGHRERAHGADITKRNPRNRVNDCED